MEKIQHLSSGYGTPEEVFEDRPQHIIDLIRFHDNEMFTVSLSPFRWLLVLLSREQMLDIFDRLDGEKAEDLMVLFVPSCNLLHKLRNCIVDELP